MNETPESIRASYMADVRAAIALADVELGKDALSHYCVVCEPDCIQRLVYTDEPSQRFALSLRPVPSLFARDAATRIRDDFNQGLHAEDKPTLVVMTQREWWTQYKSQRLETLAFLQEVDKKLAAK